MCTRPPGDYNIVVRSPSPISLPGLNEATLANSVDTPCDNHNQSADDISRIMSDPELLSTVINALSGPMVLPEGHVRRSCQMVKSEEKVVSRAKVILEGKFISRGEVMSEAKILSGARIIPAAKVMSAPKVISGANMTTVKKFVSVQDFDIRQQVNMEVYGNCKNGKL